MKNKELKKHIESEMRATLCRVNIESAKALHQLFAGLICTEGIKDVYEKYKYQLKKGYDLKELSLLVGFNGSGFNFSIYNGVTGDSFDTRNIELKSDSSLTKEEFLNQKKEIGKISVAKLLET